MVSKAMSWEEIYAHLRSYMEDGKILEIDMLQVRAVENRNMCLVNL